MICLERAFAIGSLQKKFPTFEELAQNGRGIKRATQILSEFLWRLAHASALFALLSCRVFLHRQRCEISFGDYRPMRSSSQ
jgi:hypothetical protein